MTLKWKSEAISESLSSILKRYVNGGNELIEDSKHTVMMKFMAPSYWN